MRRKDRLRSDQTWIENFLRENKTVVLGLPDKDNPVYVLPLNYGFEAPGTLWFHGAPVGRKLDLIGQGLTVGFTVYREGLVETGPQACDWGMKFQSVVGQGHLEIVTDESQKRRGLDCLMTQFKAPAPYQYESKLFQYTTVMKLSIQEVTGKEKE